MLSTSQDRIVRLSRGLLWTLDIPCLEAVEYKAQYLHCSIGYYSPVPHEEAGQSSAFDHALGPLHRFALRRIRSGLCVLADQTLIPRGHRPRVSGTCPSECR